MPNNIHFDMDKSSKERNLSDIKSIRKKAKNQKIKKERIVSDLLICIRQHLWHEAHFREPLFRGMSDFQDDQYYKDFAENVSKACDEIILPVILKTLTTSYKDEEIGLFIHALKKYGASVKESKEAIKIWAGLGKSAIDAAYKYVRKCYRPEVLDNPLSAFSYPHVLAFYLAHKNKIFPDTRRNKKGKYLSSKEAYGHLVMDINEAEVRWINYQAMKK